MASPETVVRDFVDAFRRGDPAELAGLVTDDIHFVNGASFTIDGRDAFRELFEKTAGRVVDCDFEILNLAVDGDVVLTERIDRCVIDGRPVALPVMGTFEVRDGRIAVWRDYFDRSVSGFSLD